MITRSYPHGDTMAFLLNCFLLALVLLFGCGAEESVNSPVTEEGATDVAPALKSSPYYPIALGNRWTYRNPDGSEWSREVADLEMFDAEHFHSYRYNPPGKLDSLGSSEYVKYADRFVRRATLSEINDVVRDVILESSDGDTRWAYEINCDQAEQEQEPECEIDKNPFKPRIMTILYHANPNVVWRSHLTLFRYPLVPSATYNALELRFTGRGDGLYVYDFEAEGTILGRTADDWESIETPAGSFDNCLKIQYEPKLKSFTLVDFYEDSPPFADEYLDAAREVVESEILQEFKDLLPDLIGKLGLHTTWLAPGVGPVKFETRDGIAELIHYEIKPAQ